jgi:hypothetical protein
MKRKNLSEPRASGAHLRAAAVISVIHIRRDARSPMPWVMRSCTGERRLKTLAQAVEATGCAASAAARMGRDVLIRLHGGSGQAETFTLSAWQARARTMTLPTAIASLVQMLP